ncbi:MAG TPA: hypothetical protein VI389_02770 [Geobacteraceae bacterium]
MSDSSNNTNAPAHATIGELYPDVRRLLLFIAFQEADAESEPNYQQIIFTPETEALFRFDCSRDQCMGGGFDLTPIVADLMKNKEVRVQGQLSCEGALGPGGERCGLRAEYRIIVE